MPENVWTLSRIDTSADAYVEKNYNPDSDDDDEDEDVPNGAAKDRPAVDSKLTKEVQNLIELIFNQ